MLTHFLPGTLPYHNIDPILFEWGFIVIRWYSLAYLGGLMAAWYMLAQMADAQNAPFKRLQIDDFIIWGMLGIIIGGRLGYVLFYNFSYYASHLADIPRLWDGGMSFHGGLAGVVVATILFARKHKIPLMQFADRIAIVSPIGLMFGRIANFINGELWGSPSDLPWAMVFPTGGDVARHPSQLYEAFGEGLLLFLILKFLFQRTKITHYPGMLTGVFFIGYGIARYLVEFVRVPDAQLGLIGGVISMGQILSIPMLLGGLGFILYAKKPPKGHAR